MKSRFALLLVSCCSFSGTPVAAEEYPRLFGEVLNPLPDSILFAADEFEIRQVTRLSRGEDDNGYADAIDYSGFGDLTGDGVPDIALSAWDNTNCHSNEQDSPLKAELRLFSAGTKEAELLDAQALLSRSSTNGSAFLRILDMTGDGKNDLLIISHNECPFFPMPSFLLEASGDTFIERKILPSVGMHEGTIVDFNMDGLPDIIGSGGSLNDSEAGIDTTIYPDRFQHVTAGAGVVLWINKGSGAFDFYTMKFNGPIERSKEENESDLSLKWITPGTTVTASDFDGDGEMEVVITDAFDGLDGQPSYGSSHILVDNLRFEALHFYGDIKALPDSYFRQRPEKFGSVESNFSPAAISTSLQAHAMDFDNDGDQDLIVNNLIWTEAPDETAGMLQFLRNDGGLNFVDVTESVLFNFDIGKWAPHDLIIEDVTGDGFLDLILFGAGNTYATPRQWGTFSGGEGWAGTLYRYYPKTHANEILINTGAGKFVSAFWEGFEGYMLKRQNFYEVAGFGNGPWGMNSVKMHGYVDDGRVGFVFKGDAYPEERFYFEARAGRRFHMGPRGFLGASSGVPGFSEYFYLTEYPDVAEAVASGLYSSGLDHFVKQGRNNRRIPFASNSRVRGTSGSDHIIMVAGDEVAEGLAGDDIIEGGPGTDTAVFTGSRVGYELDIVDAGLCVVTDIDLADGNDGVDRLIDVEQVQFSDGTVECEMPNQPNILILHSAFCAANPQATSCQ